MEEAPSAKKPRLSMACNECRRRKVKCDANYPQCRNCAQRSSACFTSDPKRPGIAVIREWLEDKSAPEPAVVPSIYPTSQSDGPAQPSPNTSRDTPIASGSLTATNEANEVSPVYHTYDMSFQAEHRTNRIKMTGASSSQCLMKTLDLYLKTTNTKPISSFFEFGMRHAEEMVIPLTLSFPQFPATDYHTAYAEAYFKRIHVLWPFLDIDETKNAINHFASISDLSTTPRDQIPVLAVAYLVCSIGTDEISGNFTSDGEKYLHAAAGLLGHIILVPYLATVQALLLFTITYRSRTKDGLAWQTIGMAVRIAHSLGLHRHSATRPSNQHGVTQKKDQLYHARIWAVCCCLEKMLQLESGRPSSIFSVDRDQMMGRAQRAPGHDFLQWNMALAEYQGDISQHIYGHKPGERTAKEILVHAGQVDRALLAWSNEVPSEFQPASSLFCSNEHLHYAAHLSIQYHQSMIALHRAALIAPRAVFDAEVEKHCPDEPSKFRLKRGELICAESARSIIRLSLDVQESKEDSRIFSATPLLLACTALSMYLMKYPRGKTQAADLELLRAGVDFTSEQYVKSGQDRRMAQGVKAIHDRIRLHLRQGLLPQKRLREPVQSEAERSDQSASGGSSGRPRNPHRPQSSQSQSAAPGHPCQSTSGTGSVIMSSNSVAYQDYSSLNSNHVLTTQDHANCATPDNGSNMNSWASVAPDQAFIQPGGIEQSSDNLLMHSNEGVGEIDPSRLPFGDYDTEELWNWIYFMDTDDPQKLMFQGNL